MEKKLIKTLAGIYAVTILIMVFAACDTNKGNEELEALKKEVQLLKDKMDIQDVLWRYGLRFDLDRRDEWFTLFAEDCQFSSDVPGYLYELDGLDKIKAHYSKGPGGKDRVQQKAEQAGTTPRDSWTGHVDLAGVIKIDGDNATAVGWQVGTGVRTWNLRRTNGKWLIAGTASRRLENKERCREVVPENW